MIVGRVVFCLRYLENLFLVNFTLFYLLHLYSSKSFRAGIFTLSICSKQVIIDPEDDQFMAIPTRELVKLGNRSFS